LPLISEYKRRSKGIRPAQWRLYWEDLADISVTLPCVEEQRRIADFLDAEIPRMDRIGRLRKAQQAALNERLSAIVSEYLLPGILTRPSGDGTWPWLPEPPSGQPLVRLGYVCWLQNGLTVEGAREMKGDVVTRPYLRVANVQAGRVNLDSVIEITVPRAIAARSTLRPGDVLMTEGGDLDKLGRGTVWQGEIPDCLHQNHVFALRPDPDKLDGDYLALLTQSLHGRCYFESTGVKTTNLASTNSSKILNFPIPLPTLAAQRQTVTKLRVHMQATNQVLRAIDRQNALLAERRQVLITAAVTGQMDVTTARRVTA
jgi:type I restriction enzyme S subunit